MTPKQFIKYTRRLDKKSIAICDGSTVDSPDIFSFLYPIFLLSGLIIFLWLLRRWYYIKEKVKK